jgi:hypothetical protein
MRECESGKINDFSSHHAGVQERTSRVATTFPSVHQIHATYGGDTPEFIFKFNILKNYMHRARAARARALAPRAKVGGMRQL